MEMTQVSCGVANGRNPAASECRKFPAGAGGGRLARTADGASSAVAPDAPGKVISGHQPSLLTRPVVRSGVGFEASTKMNRVGCWYIPPGTSSCQKNQVSRSV